MADQLPVAVAAAFSTGPETPYRLGAEWDDGFRVGRIVLAEVADPSGVGISSRIRDIVEGERLRVAKPVRAGDGRLTSAGWRASTFVDGRPDPHRTDETIAAAIRLDEALRNIPVPPQLVQRVGLRPTGKTVTDIFLAADRGAFEDPVTGATAWGTITEATEETRVAMSLIKQISARLEPAPDTPDQIVHLDFFHTIVFDGTAIPGVTDLVPGLHPFGYTAALAIADALIAGTATPSLIDRFAPVIPDLSALVKRGFLYRLLIHAWHPAATASSSAALVKAVEKLS